MYPYSLKTIAAIPLLLALTACESMPEWMPDWWGNKEEVILPGTRIDLLEESEFLRADPNASSITITLPAAVENPVWLQSNSSHEFAKGHLQLGAQLAVTQSFNAGNAPGSSFRLTATPVATSSYIATLSADGSVSLHRSDNGQQVWQTTLGGSALSGISAGGGIASSGDALYVTVGDNRLVVLEAATGKKRWEKSFDSPLRAAPLLYNGKVFLLSASNRLYAIDMEKRTIIWSHEGLAENLGTFGAASPVIVANLLLVPHSSGEIYALNEQDGRELWVDNFASTRQPLSYFTTTDIEATPIVDGKRAYVLGNQGMLAAIDLLSGKHLWERQISGRQRPWLAGEFLYLFTSAHNIACLEAETGKVVWVKTLDSYSDPKEKSGLIHWSGPVLAGGRLYTVGTHGALLALQPQTGETATRYKVPKDIYAPPAVANQTLYLLTNKAEVVVLK